MDLIEMIKSWSWRIKKAGLTQKEFAGRIGLAQSQISDYCAGKISPNIKQVIKIETALKDMGV